jgi:hypothetical protein
MLFMLTGGLPTLPEILSISISPAVGLGVSDLSTIPDSLRIFLRYG